MFGTIIAALISIAASATLADKLPDHPNADEIRSHTFETGDREGIARYLLDDIASAMGHLRGCGGSYTEDSFSTLTAEIAKWSEPGFKAWITGDRDEAEEWITRSAKQSFLFAAATADCSSELLIVERAKIKRLRKEIMKMISKPL